MMYPSNSLQFMWWSIHYPFTDSCVHSVVWCALPYVQIYMIAGCFSWHWFVQCYHLLLDQLRMEVVSYKPSQCLNFRKIFVLTLLSFFLWFSDFYWQRSKIVCCNIKLPSYKGDSAQVSAACPKKTYACITKKFMVEFSFSQQSLWFNIVLYDVLQQVSQLLLVVPFLHYAFLSHSLPFLHYC